MVSRAIQSMSTSPQWSTPKQIVASQIIIDHCNKANNRKLSVVWTTSNDEPAQGFPINILILKRKYINQDLRRFLATFRSYLRCYTNCSRVRKREINTTRNKLQLK